ncbi:GTPase ObgE, partial [Paracoccus sp. PXZ]
LVDGTAEDVAHDARTILTELETYSPALAEKPRVTALNKIDALDPETLAERKAALEAEIGGPVLLMSGVSREGVTEVLRALWSQIAPSRKPAGDKEDKPWQP